MMQPRSTLIQCLPVLEGRNKFTEWAKPKSAYFSIGRLSDIGYVIKLVISRMTVIRIFYIVGQVFQELYQKVKQKP